MLFLVGILYYNLEKIFGFIFKINVLLLVWELLGVSEFDSFRI